MKSVKRGVRVLRARSSRASHAHIFSVSPQSRSLFSASFQTSCLTARAYLNMQKYGLFCSLSFILKGRSCYKSTGKWFHLNGHTIRFWPQVKFTLSYVVSKMSPPFDKKPYAIIVFIYFMQVVYLCAHTKNLKIVKLFSLFFDIKHTPSK